MAPPAELKLKRGDSTDQRCGWEDTAVPSAPPPAAPDSNTVWVLLLLGSIVIGLAALWRARQRGGAACPPLRAGASSFVPIVRTLRALVGSAPATADAPAQEGSSSYQRYPETSLQLNPGGHAGVPPMVRAPPRGPRLMYAHLVTVQTLP